MKQMSLIHKLEAEADAENIVEIAASVAVTVAVKAMVAKVGVEAAAEVPEVVVALLIWSGGELPEKSCKAMFRTS